MRRFLFAWWSYASGEPPARRARFARSAATLRAKPVTRIASIGLARSATNLYASGELPNPKGRGSQRSAATATGEARHPHIDSSGFARSATKWLRKWSHFVIHHQVRALSALRYKPAFGVQFPHRRERQLQNPAGHEAMLHHRGRKQWSRPRSSLRPPAVGQNLQSQGLRTGNRVLLAISVDHNPGEFKYLGDPTAVPSQNTTGLWGSRPKSENQPLKDLLKSYQTAHRVSCTYNPCDYCCDFTMRMRSHADDERIKRRGQAAASPSGMPDQPEKHWGCRKEVV